MGMFSQSKEILAAEKKRQSDAKQVKGKVTFTGWLLRIFYTVFMLMATYTIILTCTLSIPNVMDTLIQSFGYNLNSSVELVLALLSGLFFTAWMFALSFFVVKKLFEIYIRKMKETVQPAEQATPEETRAAIKSSKCK